MVLDRFGRPLRSLRVSVTDRCNLRCQYCMPELDYVWLPRESLLTFEETAGVIDAFTDLGVDRVRITGGEPLLRRNLPDLVADLASRPAIRDLALTTNGVLLAQQADALKSAGLHRITVSLDTLDPRRFETLARFDRLDDVLDGIAAAARAGFDSLKIDTVVMRGVNDDELGALHRIRSAGGRRGEVHRVHGRRRRHEMVARRRRLAPGDTRAARRRASGRSHPSSRSRRHRRTGSSSRTARRSASSRRPPSRSARRAIAPASPPTASG